MAAALGSWQTELVKNKGFETGLVGVSTERLRTLLRGLHRETLPCPLTPVGLATHGLQDDANSILNHLRGLERAAVHAVVVAALAERMAAEERRAAEQLAADR